LKDEPRVDDLQPSLIDRLRHREERAFAEVYHKYNHVLIRFALSITQNAASAEEIVQDTWVSVLRGIDRFEGRSSLRAWIFTILINRARTRLRQDARLIPFEGAETENDLPDAFDGRGKWAQMPALWDEVTAERVVEGRSILAHVNTFIDDLPAAQRAVLILRTQSDMEPAEICSLLGITDGHMRVLLFRGRQSLRAALDRLLA
jgi:RNA polymerase sigma-70 factor (ECF subfamily)